MSNNDFSFSLARTLCELSAATYTRDMAPLDGERWVKWIEEKSTDTVAQIVSTREANFLAFRGTTTDLRNWLTDVELQLVHSTIGEGRVHAGFLNAWLSVRADVLSDLGYKPLYITGHSLGGALAILCAADLASEKIPVWGVHTFGQPRVSDRTFARYYDLVRGPITWRHIHSADIVPHVPCLLGRYRHVGGEVFYYNDAGKFREHAPLWWKLQIELAAISEGSLSCALADHAISTYLNLFTTDKNSPLSPLPVQSL